MRAILYICHGSRVKKGQQAALAFIEKTMETAAAPIQEACFLELAEPSIAEGIARCIERGATEIVAIPFLLLRAGHAIADIPAELHEVMTHYPEVPIYYGDPIGVDERMVDVLIERLYETADVIPDGAAILLIGRGSSDPATKEDFTAIKRSFQEKTGLQNVSVGYLAACGPFFAEELERLLKQQPKNLYILPYLLFTGILMKSIERTLKTIETSTAIHLCPALGYHPAIHTILNERASEAAERKRGLYVPHHA
ncbi:sirohydrochlorin chelatase [Sporosarcina sp. P37]|uniref:sirohydrochlorin chelatase n=1 Tax=unclassified Sporosarcina TaxID=2647733 RepID=UPI0009BFF202|nr:MULTISPECIES: sirohydrochlorin chelatase [unclassified Sporosarcina]ARD47722.1 sirohydrochlorin ferrochelatase [Sporosarcina sp. P33]ARK24254.1 sirohydrochlorin chelatase [Sporosarcina sp. P37]PID18469.1 sirohydrochlorin chelatase [Sporosarcina sp. P35]